MSALTAFLAGFVAFPVCVTVLGWLVVRHDRRVMRGMGGERAE